jgi:hypothetical protein
MLFIAAADKNGAALPGQITDDRPAEISLLATK